MSEEKKRVNLINATRTYIKETQSEAKKVSWPSRQYVTTATTIIVVLVIVLSLVLMGLDYGLGQIISTLTKVRF